MGYKITPKGEKYTVTPKAGKKFTIEDISYLLNGIVEPIFFVEGWIFINKMGAKLDLMFNKPCTEAFGLPIYGDCLIIPMDELESQFFIPENVIQYFNPHQNVKKQQPIDTEDEINNSNEDILINQEKKKKDEQKQRVDFYFRNAFTQLFNKNKNPDDIFKDFVIFDNGEKILRLEDNMDSRISFLEKMLTYFSSIEEYEKCKDIQDLQLHAEWLKLKQNLLQF